MLPEQVTQELKKEYEQALSHLKKQLAQINVGRANAAVLENIEVDAGSYKAKLQELASLRSVEPQTLLVEPWDLNLSGAIERAILAANLNLSVQPQKNGLYVKFPGLTQETRQRAKQQVEEFKEEARVRARQIREEKWQQIQQRFENKEITEDERFRIRELLDEQIKEINEQIEQIAQAKIRQIQEG